MRQGEGSGSPPLIPKLVKRGVKVRMRRGTQCLGGSHAGFSARPLQAHLPGGKLSRRG